MPTICILGKPQRVYLHGCRRSVNLVAFGDSAFMVANRESRFGAQSLISGHFLVPANARNARCLRRNTMKASPL
jgi:hypothetical protein